MVDHEVDGDDDQEADAISARAAKDRAPCRDLTPLCRRAPALLRRPWGRDRGRTPGTLQWPKDARGATGSGDRETPSGAATGRPLRVAARRGEASRKGAKKKGLVVSGANRPRRAHSFARIPPDAVDAGDIFGLPDLRTLFSSAAGTPRPAPLPRHQIYDIPAFREGVIFVDFAFPLFRVGADVSPASAPPRPRPRSSKTRMVPRRRELAAQATNHGPGGGTDPPTDAPPRARLDATRAPATAAEVDRWLEALARALVDPEASQGG